MGGIGEIIALILRATISLEDRFSSAEYSRVAPGRETGHLDSEAKKLSATRCAGMICVIYCPITIHIGLPVVLEVGPFVTGY